MKKIKKLYLLFALPYLGCILLSHHPYLHTCISHKCHHKCDCKEHNNYHFPQIISSEEPHQCLMCLWQYIKKNIEYNTTNISLPIFVVSSSVLPAQETVPQQIKINSLNPRAPPIM